MHDRASVCSRGKARVLASARDEEAMARFSVGGLFHESPFIRLGARAIVFVLVTYVLLALARHVEPELSITSLPITITLVTAFVLVEAVLFVLVKTLFKRVS
jgi:uncharacterized membrane protein YvlD (DUF360 family)